MRQHKKRQLQTPIRCCTTAIRSPGNTTTHKIPALVFLCRTHAVASLRNSRFLQTSQKSPPFLSLARTQVTRQLRILFTPSKYLAIQSLQYHLRQKHLASGFDYNNAPPELWMKCLPDEEIRLMYNRPAVWPYILLDCCMIKQATTLSDLSFNNVLHAARLDFFWLELFLWSDELITKKAKSSWMESFRETAGPGFWTAAAEG